MQTAVKWLIQQLMNNPLPQSHNEFIEGDLADVIKKAKQMEKEQIIKANRNGVDMLINHEHFVTGEQYYNETYGEQ